MIKALFLDRDGVINIDHGHVYKIEEFEVFPKIFDICLKYQAEGYIIIVISNQAGIGKGLYKEEDLLVLDQYMKNIFKEKQITITDSFYCPHKPSDNCSCRKPKPGLILMAKEKYNICLEESVLIGDKMSDLEAGNNAGIKKLYFHKTRYEEYPVAFNYDLIEY